MNGERDEFGCFLFTDGILEMTKNFIDTFSADMGGTNILDPLKTAYTTIQNCEQGKKYYKNVVTEARIFVLTDGQVSNRDEVINLPLKHGCRIHTFGIGTGCDQTLVKGLAKTGRGSCSMIKDLNQESLNA